MASLPNLASLAGAMSAMRKGAHDRLFGLVHGNRLIYNTCWEDPRLDRQMLRLGPDSEVVMLTSAGCNALDYLLDGPRRICCVDMNFRQNALLELKLAVIRHLDYQALWALFGQGATADYKGIFQAVRGHLSFQTRTYWDKHQKDFDPAAGRGSFYFHGASGDVAWFMAKVVLRLRKELRDLSDRLLEAKSLAEQQEIYARAEPILWNKVVSWLIKRPFVMALLGVPRPQIELIAASHAEGLLGYVRDKLRHVMTQVPIADNYFWRVYLTGHYTPACCPGYLKPENFAALQSMAERVSTHTDTLSGFLYKNPGAYSHYVLLDHQDWLAWNLPVALAEEWQLIFANSRQGDPRTKILLRSAGLDTAFLPAEAASRLRFLPEITAPLHPQDRVGTYGSVHFAEVL